MHLADEVAHRLQRAAARLDHQVHAVAEHVEVGVGDQRGHLDQRVGGQVETGHLTVDPDQEVPHPATVEAQAASGLAAYAGTHLINQADPAQVSTPMVTAAAASVATALTTLTTSGPAAPPRSLHSRQPPMNWARSAAGAASAPEGHHHAGRDAVAQAHQGWRPR